MSAGREEELPRKTGLGSTGFQEKWLSWYKKDTYLSASLMYEAGHPEPAPSDNLEGWGGEAGRWAGDSGCGCTRVCLWLIHTDVRQKPSHYCKAIILQLK